MRRKWRRRPPQAGGARAHGSPAKRVLQAKFLPARAQCRRGDARAYTLTSGRCEINARTSTEATVAYSVVKLQVTGSLQADVRQVLGAVPAQIHPVLPSPGVSPSYNNSSRHSDTCREEGDYQSTNLLSERRRRGGPACRAAVQARDEKKKRARANYVCAIPRALASPFDPGRHSYEKSPREIPEAALYT